MFKWSKDKPTKPGWYWMRRKENIFQADISEDEISIEKVRDYVGKLCIMNWEIPNNVEWAGPIPEPDAKE